MLCKNLRSEVHGRAVLLAWVPDRHRVGVFGLCVFSIPRVFYHCPTTSATPVSKNTCRPGRKFFQFQNHYRPCVGHATVCATPDCVHRVTVLCAVPCAPSLVCDHLGVSGVRSTCAVGPAPAVPHCSTMLYSSTAVSTVLCSVLCRSVPPCRRRRLVMLLPLGFLARSGARYQSLPTGETKPKTMWSCMWNPLPTLTRIRARGAKPIGAFGLVTVPLPIVTK